MEPVTSDSKEIDEQSDFERLLALVERLCIALETRNLLDSIPQQPVTWVIPTSPPPSGGGGYFLPLSGGADSAATCAMVGIMCHLVVDAIRKGDAVVKADAKRVVGESKSDYVPHDPAEFASRILHTCYMGTSNSSAATASRAATLAQQVGGYHLNVNIDSMV